MTDLFETQCPACEGAGHVPLGVHYVTHDMAIDAGEPDMEGEVYETEYGACEQCEGTGITNVEEA